MGILCLSLLNKKEAEEYKMQVKKAVKESRFMDEIMK